jgi:chemotaxis family two-component system response regulator Rcp1
MNGYKQVKPINILLVEDNPADVRLTQEVFKEGRIRNTLNVVMDGEEAIDYLRRKGQYVNVEMPDLMLLDLNLPKKDGREVLAEIKADDELKTLPVIVLTTSAAEQDILNTYAHHANCYIMKPVDLGQFIKVVRSIEEFWLTVVKLPPMENR